MAFPWVKGTFGGIADLAAGLELHQYPTEIILQTRPSKLNHVPADSLEFHEAEHLDNDQNRELRKAYVHRLVRELLADPRLLEDGTRNLRDSFQTKSFAEFFWELFMITDTLMASSVLRHAFGSGYEYGAYWNNCPDPKWDELSYEASIEALEAAANAWIISVADIGAHLGMDENLYDLEQQWFSRLIQLFKNLEKVLSSVCDRLRLVWQFFLELAILTNDLYEALQERGGGMNLHQVGLLRSRHDVLADLAGTAPFIKNLEAYARDLAASLPQDERTCSVCMTSEWEGPEFDVACSRATADGIGLWIYLTPDKNKLLIKKGYEELPLKLPCGHIFCASCAKRWLDEVQHLSCPNRDDDYGVRRSKAVRDIEELGRRMGVVPTAIVWREGSARPVMPRLLA